MCFQVNWHEHCVSHSFDDFKDGAKRDGGAQPYGDGEIAEIVAVVAWKTFANYFNHVAGTDVDFHEVSEIAAA